MTSVKFIQPTIRFAPQISNLVKNTPFLDNNSDYLYALMCTRFAQNSAVAIKADEVIAFVTGFRCPASPDTYFLWQTATKPRHGIPNLGINLINFAADNEISKGAKAIEASVDTENAPITVLMKILCKRLGGELKTGLMFSSQILSANGSAHHDETLYRIELPEILTQGQQRPDTFDQSGKGKLTSWIT